MVADAVMEEYEGVIIEQCVKSNYSFLEENERQAIIKEAKLIAKEKDGIVQPDYGERRIAVYDAALKYLEENSVIIPCGFVDFRFRDFFFYTEKIVSLAYDIYFDKREYEEFTYLLSMFVASKEKKEEVIHVVWDEDKVYLYNKRGRDVTRKYEKEFLSMVKKHDINQEDLAISAVISAAPERLVLHTEKESPLRDALEKIYIGKCKVCTGCSFCKKY